APQSGPAPASPSGFRNGSESLSRSDRVELAVPIEEVAPALVQEVRWEGAAVLLQRMRRGLAWSVLGIHTAFLRQPAPLEEIAGGAGGDDVVPGRAAAARARHDMVEGQVLRRMGMAAILASKAVAQEDVEPRKGRPPRRRDVFLERDDARQPHLETRAADHLFVFGDDVDPFEEHCLHRLLPGPER